MEFFKLHEKCLLNHSSIFLRKGPFQTDTFEGHIKEASCMCNLYFIAKFSGFLKQMCADGCLSLYCFHSFKH